MRSDSFPRAGGIRVITGFPYGRLDKKELTNVRKQLAYQEKQCAGFNAGVVYASVSSAQIGGAQVLSSRRGWKLQHSFVNPNSGNECFIWMKDLTGGKK